jgi:hypothetical protein
METTRIAHRTDGTAQGASQIQAQTRPALVGRGRETAPQFGEGNTPTGVLSLKLQRPEAAIRSKAQRKGFRSSPPIARPTTGVPVSPSLPAIPCRRVPQQTARCLGAVVDFAEQHGLEPLRLGRVRSASMRWRGADNPAARSRKRRFSNLTGVHELATLAPRSFFPRRRHPWGSQKLLALSS